MLVPRIVPMNNYASTTNSTNPPQATTSNPTECSHVLPSSSSSASSFPFPCLQLKAIISPDAKAKPSNDADADADTDADTDAKGKKKSSGTALAAKVTMRLGLILILLVGARASLFSRPFLFGTICGCVVARATRPRLLRPSRSSRGTSLLTWRPTGRCTPAARKRRCVFSLHDGSGGLHRYNSETGKNVRKVGAVAILFGLSQISTCVPSSRVSVHACNRMYRLRTTSCAALARFFLPP